MAFSVERADGRTRSKEKFFAPWKSLRMTGVWGKMCGGSGEGEAMSVERTENGGKRIWEDSTKLPTKFENHEP